MEFDLSGRKVNWKFDGFCPDKMDFGSRVYEAKDFCQKEDSAEERKHAIQRAVDACAGDGGGTVIVNAGKWPSAAIRLHDNICLFLQEGAEIHFSQDYKDYLPAVFTRWEGVECYNYSPLIYADGCANIKIAGKGTLYGGGEAWWHWKKLQHTAARELYYAQNRGIPVKDRIYGTPEAALRPSFIQLIRCRNVCMEEFRIVDGPH